MNEKMVIAVTGTISSGKDTFAQKFIENGYTKFSFADSLKSAVGVIFGWDRELLEGNTHESRKWREEIDPFWSKELGYNVTPRYILQYMGTDVLRKHFNDNIWIMSLENKIKNSESDKIIITDCRFPNEIKLMKKMKATIVEIQRNIPLWYSMAKKYNTGEISYFPKELESIHISEYGWVGLNNPNYVVSNDDTILSLHKKSEELLKLI